jgi:aminopeptidase N
MNLPHAPYLFMMAIGDFVVTKDRWRDVEVDLLHRAGVCALCQRNFWQHTGNDGVFFAKIRL